MYDSLHINSFRQYIFKVLTLTRFLITEPVIKGFLDLTSPLTRSDRALTQVYLYPRLLTPEDETHVDRICPNVFAAFPASLSHVQVVGLSLSSFRSLSVPIILKSTMLCSPVSTSQEKQTTRQRVSVHSC